MLIKCFSIKCRQSAVTTSNAGLVCSLEWKCLFVKPIGKTKNFLNGELKAKLQASLYPWHWKHIYSFDVVKSKPMPPGISLLGLMPSHCWGFSYMVTTQLPPRPKLCWSARFAEGTWRDPASPRSCQFSSQHWATPRKRLIALREMNSGTYPLRQEDVPSKSSHLETQISKQRLSSLQIISYPMDLRPTCHHKYYLRFQQACVLRLPLLIQGLHK